MKTYLIDRDNLNKTLFIGSLAVVAAALGYVSISHALTGGGYGYGYGVPTSTTAVLRDYSPGTGDHFFTTDATESGNAVSSSGYVSEGTGFNAWAKGVTQAAAGSRPTYRAYNPRSRDHFYTNSFTEYLNAQNAGYRLESVAFYSYNSINDPATTVFVNPVYRLYNPGSGHHFYTTSAAEQTSAISTAGFISEGTGFFAPQ